MGQAQHRLPTIPRPFHNLHHLHHPSGSERRCAGFDVSGGGASSGGLPDDLVSHCPPAIFRWLSSQRSPSILNPCAPLCQKSLVISHHQTHKPRRTHHHFFFLSHSLSKVYGSSDGLIFGRWSVVESQSTPLADGVQCQHWRAGNCVRAGGRSGLELAACTSFACGQHRLRDCEHGRLTALQVLGGVRCAWAHGASTWGY